MNLKIGGRLILGYSVMVLVLAIAVGATLWSVTSIDRVTNRMVELRTPTAQASASMVNNINASLAALRGWMLTGNKAFKKDRTAIWADIAKVQKDMDTLSKSWTDSANIEQWSEFKTILAKFNSAQTKVEAIAHSTNEQPATKLLVTEAAPPADIMIENINKMIDLELSGNGGVEGDRVQVLGIMSDVRGTLSLGLANIRAYLLTGDTKFVEDFKQLWAKNEKRFWDLSTASSFLSNDQKSAFEAFTVKRDIFKPLPEKMFAIRASEQWNMANYTLVKEAAPLADKLLTYLLGHKAADGARGGGMVDSQRKLLEKDAEYSASHVHQLFIIEWILLGVGLIIAAIVVTLSIKSIVSPVVQMTRAMSQLAEGDISFDLSHVKEGDEIGDMAKAVEVFKQNKITADALAIEQEMEQRTKQERAERIEVRSQKFDDSVNMMVQTVEASITQMSGIAASLSGLATSSSEQSTTVAAAAEEASANVQTVASAAEELTASIGEISLQVNHSSEVSDAATKEAIQANEKVQSLAEAAQRIGEVVSLITDIAEQTNLLALNATIEAARAGEAGKGFAVVASEVKNLANQTAKATDEIGSQIGTVQTATEEAVQSITGISQTIEQMTEIASAIASAVEEQGMVTQEIARNVEEAAAGTADVSQNIGQVAAAASETGSSSQEVLEASSSVSKEVKELQTEINAFLADVKAS